MAKRLMRNLVALSVAFMMLAGGFLNTTQLVYAASGDTTVYITKTGECYHADGCSSLKKSKIATTLSNAVSQGLRPCSKCKPVTLDAGTNTTKTQPAASTTTAAASANSSVGDTTVYLTKTGKCYHSDGCSSLSKSKIPTTLSNALAKGYTACSKCKPATTAAQAPVVSADTESKEVEALKNYAGNNNEFNAYNYYKNNADIQTVIGPNGDALLKHFNEHGKAEGRSGK